MKVSELIEHLKTVPQDIEVVIEMFSEQELLDWSSVQIVNGCPPRPDGWVQNQRPDIEPQEYLLFPGN